MFRSALVPMAAICVLLGLGFPWALVVRKRIADDYVAALATGRCETVVGVVRRNSNVTNASNGEDNIIVGNVAINVSPFPSRPGYHQTVEKGGYLREGRCVKICLLYGQILEIIKRDDCEQ